jgi:glycosyltransferase involved in cell wall biosynthesis
MADTNTPLLGWRCGKRLERVRVMLVTGSFPPQRCGVGDYSARLAHGLAAEPGVEVAVLTGADWAADMASVPPGVTVIPAIPRWTIRHAARAFREIRRWRADVVHLQHPTQGYRDEGLTALIPAIAFLAGARVVRTWHEPTTWGSLRDWRGVIRFMAQAVIPGAFIVVRPNLREMLHPVLRVLPFPRRFRYIPNASTIASANMSEIERERLRHELRKGQKRLIVYFGFINAGKGVDQLFEIADPATDHLVLMGEGEGQRDYHVSICKLAEDPRWAGKATILGYRGEAEVARVLAAADAVLLPFRAGGGMWNTSIHAARSQGSLIIATSRNARGWNAAEHTFWAAPGDIAGMRAALAQYVGTRRARRLLPVPKWPDIIHAHLAAYRGTDHFRDKPHSSERTVGPAEAR